MNIYAFSRSRRNSQGPCRQYILSAIFSVLLHVTGFIYILTYSLNGSCSPFLLPVLPSIHLKKQKILLSG